MFPQSELENYKVKVELLQEKLRRSEEYRQRLQENLECVLKRHRELKHRVKFKERLKYRSFLEQQRERNERNKQLIRALEKADQRAAIMAARSEQLKNSKTRYELYFNNNFQFERMNKMPLSYSCLTTSPSLLPPDDFHNDPSALSSLYAMKNVVFLPVDSNYLQASLRDGQHHRNQVLTTQSDILLPNDIESSEQSGRGGIERPQVNLKPTTRDLIMAGISPQNLCNQIDIFADIGNPIDSSRYKMKKPAKGKEPDEPYFDGYDETSTGTVSYGSGNAESDKRRQRQPQHHEENLNEIDEDSSSRQCRRDNVKYASSVSIHPRNEQQQQPFEGGSNNSGRCRTRPEPFVLGKLHSIKRDNTLGKLLPGVDEDVVKGPKADSSEDDEDENNDIYGGSGPNEGEKFNSRYKPGNENMPATTNCDILRRPERRIESVSSVAVRETVIDGSVSDKNPIEFGSSVRADKLGADYSPHIKRKEKLSIETIENAIYGERITPVAPLLPTLPSSSTSSHAPNNDRLEELQQNFTDKLKIDKNKVVLQPPSIQQEVNAGASENEDEFNRSIDSVQPDSQFNNQPQEVSELEQQYAQPLDLTSEEQYQSNERNYLPSEFQQQQQQQQQEQQQEQQPYNVKDSYNNYNTSEWQYQYDGSNTTQEDGSRTFIANEGQTNQPQDNADYNGQLANPQYSQYSESYSSNQAEENSAYGDYQPDYSESYSTAQPENQTQQYAEPQYQDVQQYDYQQYPEQNTDENYSQPYLDADPNEQLQYSEDPQQYLQPEASDQLVNQQIGQEISEYQTEPVENHPYNYVDEENRNYDPGQTEDVERTSTVFEDNENPVEAAKPTSILSTSERSSDSPTAAGKSKKKKRVIFADSDSSLNSSLTSTDNAATPGRNAEKSDSAK